MPALFPGHQTQLVTVDQAAATVDIAAAPTGKNERIFVVTICLGLAAAGTVRFTEGTGPTNLTGDLPIPASGGFVMSGTTTEPILWTRSINSKLSLVSSQGCDGWIVYFISDANP